MIPAIAIAIWQYTITQANGGQQGGLYSSSAQCLVAAKRMALALHERATIECYEIGVTGARIPGTTVRLRVPQTGSQSEKT
jgi:hypothetical protein